MGPLDPFLFECRVPCAVCCDRAAHRIRAGIGANRGHSGKALCLIGNLRSIHEPNSQHIDLFKGAALFFRLARSNQDFIWIENSQDRNATGKKNDGALLFVDNNI
jgi:hypothetical protein